MGPSSQSPGCKNGRAARIFGQLFHTCERRQLTHSVSAWQDFAALINFFGPSQALFSLGYSPSLSVLDWGEKRISFSSIKSSCSFSFPAWLLLNCKSCVRTPICCCSYRRSIRYSRHCPRLKPASVGRLLRAAAKTTYLLVGPNDLRGHGMSLCLRRALQSFPVQGSLPAEHLLVLYPKADQEEPPQLPLSS